MKNKLGAILGLWTLWGWILPLTYVSITGEKGILFVIAWIGPATIAITVFLMWASFWEIWHDE